MIDVFTKKEKEELLISTLLAEIADDIEQDNTRAIIYADFYANYTEKFPFLSDYTERELKNIISDYAGSSSILLDVDDYSEDCAQLYEEVPNGVGITLTLGDDYIYLAEEDYKYYVIDFNNYGGNTITKEDLDRFQLIKSYISLSLDELVEKIKTLSELDDRYFVYREYAIKAGLTFNPITCYR